MVCGQNKIIVIDLAQVQKKLVKLPPLNFANHLKILYLSVIFGQQLNHFLPLSDCGNSNVADLRQLLQVFVFGTGYVFFRAVQQDFFDICNAMHKSNLQNSAD